MALSTTEWNALIASVGDDDGTVADNRAFVEARASARAGLVTTDTTLNGLLQYQYARLEAIDLLMGAVRRRVTFAERDRRLQLSDMLKNLLLMKEEAQAHVDTITTQAGTTGGNKGLRVGSMAAQDGATQRPGYPDTNSPYYRGEPYTYYPATQRG